VCESELIGKKTASKGEKATWYWIEKVLEAEIKVQMPSLVSFAGGTGQNQFGFRFTLAAQVYLW